MNKILIVDDDHRIGKFLSQFLGANNFITQYVDNGTEASKVLSNNNFDLIILDVMMPAIGGIELATMIRQQQHHAQLPIIMLSAAGDAEARIQGLKVGADDYMAKPFEPEELILRINNLLNRQAAHNSDVMLVGDWEFDPVAQTLTLADKALSLSSSEAKLLKLLYDSNAKPMPREHLAKAMGGINERSVDVQIIRLRQKIELDPSHPQIIKTIRHQGYLLVRS